jgi:transcriptional regulator with XRE-family HTH domain
MDYIEKLHELRSQKGWSVLELGYQCEGLSEEAVRSILYKRCSPRISSLKIICDALEVPLSELFCGTDEIVVKNSPEICALLSAFETLPPKEKNLVTEVLNMCIKIHN